MYESLFISTSYHEYGSTRKYRRHVVINDDPPPSKTRNTACIIQGNNISLASAHKQRSVMDTSALNPSKIVLFRSTHMRALPACETRLVIQKSTINVLLIPPFVPSRCPPWVLEYFRLDGQHALAFSLSPRCLPYLKESAAKKCKFNTSPVKKSRSAFTRATAHDVPGLSGFH